jgi:sulfonate transport system substrate-binding protein
MHARPDSRARALIRRSISLIGAVALCGTATAGIAATGSSAATKRAAPINLSGVTITFGDQLKEYQTIFTATNALKGAAYTVNWSDFVGGPPIIAAETGGSVDLGDMAETPTIFAHAAGDPVKVIAATVGANPKISPYDILVPKNSSIKKLSQLRGHTVAVQEGTVEQYFLIQALKKAGIPYNGVTIENLSVTSASTAVTSGKVDAAVVTQPLTALDVQGGTVQELVNGAGYLQTIGYLTASQAALDNPQKKAALADFVNRFYKAAAILRKNPTLAAETYVKTYGVPLSVAKAAVASVESASTPVTPSIMAYQQQESNTMLKLGLITSKQNVKGIFDLPFNKVIAKQAGLS